MVGQASHDTISIWPPLSETTKREAPLAEPSCGCHEDWTGLALHSNPPVGALAHCPTVSCPSARQVGQGGAALGLLRGVDCAWHPCSVAPHQANGVKVAVMALASNLG